MWRIGRRSLSAVFMASVDASCASTFIQYHHCPSTCNHDFLLLIKLPCMLETPSTSPAGMSCLRWWNCAYSTGTFSDDGLRLEGGQTNAAACWNCGRAPSGFPFLVCGVCRSVQPADPAVDYFQIFGLEKGYELRSDYLENKYKDWQKKLHPDLVHTKSEQERSFAAEQSARIIDAYRTLTKPLSRALYLLKLEGLDVDEERTISDPELLAEVMEIREAVEQADNPKALESLKFELEEKLQEWSDSFREALKGRRIEDAVSWVRRMTYYDRAIQEIIRKL